MKTKHPKIQELRKKAKPINYLSDSYVDASGTVVLNNYKLGIKDEATRTIKGYLAVFGNVDLQGEKLVKGCFAKSIAERGPNSTSKYKILMLWQHDFCDPIGQFTKLVEDDYGLYFEAVLDAVPNGDRTLLQIKSGTLNQFSIGYDYVWDKVEYDETDDSLVLLEVMLFEGSVVTLGANMETYAIKAGKDLVAAKEDLDYETEEVLKSIPFNKRLEFKQLLTKHIQLATLEPRKKKKTSEHSSRKQENEIVETVVFGYKLNLNEIKQ
jgi:HK97 family phage prohead protease